MKTKLSSLTVLVTVLVSGIAVHAQNDGMEYEIVSRSDSAPVTSGFSYGGDPNEIVLTVEPVLHDETVMMKRAVVGNEKVGSWQLMCDEGGTAAYVQQAPNPLSYLIAGSSQNLFSALTITADEMGLEAEITVEQRMTFRQPGLMTDQAEGFTDVVTSHILIESTAEPADLLRLRDEAMKRWTAGEGLSAATLIDTELLINGEHFAERGATPGTIGSDTAAIDGFKAMKGRNDHPAPTTMTPAEDFVMTPNNLDLDFELISVARSAGDSGHPLRGRATVRCNMPGYRAWDIYCDDGAEATAPSSLHYFTAGTGLCLTTQVTGANMALKLDVDDFRIEQRIFYGESETRKVDTCVLTRSEESAEELEDLFDLSVQMCFAGEALQNETEMATGLYINGEVVE